MAKKVNPGTLVVITNTKNQILLHRRSDNGKWGLPGGSCNFGENWQKTVIREVKEETGLIIAIQNVFGIFSDPNHFIFSYPDGNHVQGFMPGFHCNVVGGKMKKTTKESLEIKWFDFDKMPKNIWEMYHIVIDSFHEYSKNGKFAIK